MKNTTLGKKIAICFFAAAFCGVGFFARRLVLKPGYEMREQLQCNLLAESSLVFMVNELVRSQQLGELFLGGEAILALDHRKMPGNWTVRFTADCPDDNREFVLCVNAASGWNSRAPKSARRCAQLYYLNGRLTFFGDHMFFTMPDGQFPPGPSIPLTRLDGKELPLSLEAPVGKIENSADGHTYLIVMPIDHH